MDEAQAAPPCTQCTGPTVYSAYFVYWSSVPDQIGFVLQFAVRSANRFSHAASPNHGLTLFLMPLS